MLMHTKMAPESATINSVFGIGLQAELQNRLHETSSLHYLGAHEMVFMEGDDNENVYEVVEGVVILSKLTADGRRQVTGFVYPGQLFGVSLGDSSGYTAETVTAVRLRRYPYQSLDQSMDLYPSLGRRFLRWTSNELVAAQNQMLLLGRKSAMEKLASFLLHLSERSEAQDRDLARLFVPMTRGDIADYLGLTTETVSRTISRFRQLGIIELRERGYIHVCDFDRLTDFAEDEGCLH